jgi:methyl-accepting chemotaxis protein
MSKEQHFSAEQILLSTTDLDSTIKYANKHFCDIAGYSYQELAGNPHNIVRHSDMPQAAFKDLWGNIQGGQSWMGPVKNRCKNGDYYWVNAFVTPIKDQDGKVFEYQSVRTKPERAVVERAANVYNEINAGKTPKALKFSTDFSLWFQLFFMLVMVFSLGLVGFSDLPLWASLPLLLLSIAFNGLYAWWRKKYCQLIADAKSVFDNPLMKFIYSGSNDDIGAINLALQMRAAELKAVVGRVCDASLSITDKAKESAECGEGISATLNQQHNEIDQVATATNQMSATIAELASVVANAATSSQQGLEISKQGQQLVQQTISANNGMAAQLTEVEQAIARLVNGSKSIETVLAEISGIADQTNLLALNAAIEAARAGEHGRGFAVVADEVRALAMRTQQSTEEINGLLSQLQQESHLANEAMTKGSDLSQRCVEFADKNGGALDNIIAEMSQLADLNDQIATAIEEQSVVTEQINRNVVSISQMSYQTQEHGQQSVSLSADLLVKMQDQQALVTQFIDKQSKAS